jgi:hypothetical protein
MTDRLTVALFALAAFLLTLAFLGYPLHGLGAPRAADARPHEILVRRVYLTKVVERVPATGAGGSSKDGATVSQSVSGSSSLPYPVATSAPVTRTS